MMSEANDNGEPVLATGFGDSELMLNMRGWLERALYAAGAKYGGSCGCGMGAAEINIELEGHLYNVRIAPIIRS